MNGEGVVCDRYSRAKTAQTYTNILFDPRVIEGVEFNPSWNISPSSIQPVLYREGPKAVRWGYSPTFAGKKRPMVAHCRMDDQNSATWKTFWKIAPAIVPADGWYEWLREGDKIQPYFVKPVSEGPVYLAALSSVAPDEQAQETDGFVLVTSGAEPGLVDKSSYRPAAFSASNAIRWLDPKTTFGVGKKMVDELLLDRQLFRYFRVSVGVNSVTNDEPAFNDPLVDDMLA